jgi:hypothetical protein
MGAFAVQNLLSEKSQVRKNFGGIMTEQSAHEDFCSTWMIIAQAQHVC